MKKVFLLIFLVVLVSSCNSHNSQNLPKEKNLIIQKMDPVNVDKIHFSDGPTLKVITEKEDINKIIKVLNSLNINKLFPDQEKRKGYNYFIYIFLKAPEKKEISIAFTEVWISYNDTKYYSSKDTIKIIENLFDSL
ncbi:lipoprotein [Paramaledivibacter caminithermalis]|uniref:Lipoprotein n=1 Tax=Paramaledivibacter caminithermalis (strain DSM 15212 / CIP 107654 / DViRD3) TaxID=1121301 RepID=A0A1M6R1U3_PARC5|nr:lipoprotein [Paramaledivibacter caminithermalis]SHK26412.1 hypothetical protein SAMN02745912_02806 [Paramaledivibacter caminithermalis DSM 15212]